MANGVFDAFRRLSRRLRNRRRRVRESFLDQFSGGDLSPSAPPVFVWSCPNPEQLEPRVMFTASPETDFAFENGVVTGYSGPGGDVVIPPVIDGQQVTGIGNNAFQNRAITSIEIPEGVTSIGSFAFTGCTSLTSITLPNTLAVIDDWAFSSCTSLTSIVIPEGFTSIDSYAFRGCTALASITLPSSLMSIGFRAFEHCSNLSAIEIAEGNTTFVVQDGILYDAAKTHVIRALPGFVNDVSLVPTVTSIGESAFSGCTSLTSIVIPEGVTNIRYDTFWGCISLTSIVIPEGVTSIDSSAFWGCTSLTSIVIPEGITSIGYSAFSGCKSLRAIVFTGDFVSHQQPDLESANSLVRVFYNPARSGWPAVQDNPAYSPIDMEHNAVPLSTNGSTTLLLTLDNGLIVSDSSAVTTTTVTNAGQNANAFLWGRWIVGEAAALAGKHLLFATDVSSGITHRITASTEWSIQEPANAVGNAFSEVLPRAARGSAYPVNPDAPAVPETVLVPIDLWGNARLHRTVSGRLFANGTELPTITEQGFRALAAETVALNDATEANRVLFKANDGRIQIWEFDGAWASGQLNLEASVPAFFLTFPVRPPPPKIPVGSN